MIAPGRAGLIVFRGPPGTGKTTISSRVAAGLGATWLRIDAIEQAIKSAADVADSPVGYAAAGAVANGNLLLGRTVVVDGVHPVAESRDAWRRMAADVGAPILQVEITCADPVEHRRRVETRVADLPGHDLPSWMSVTARRYERAKADLVLDTSRVSVDAAVGHVIDEWERLMQGKQR